MKKTILLIGAVVILTLATFGGDLDKLNFGYYPTNAIPNHLDLFGESGEIQKKTILLTNWFTFEKLDGGIERQCGIVQSNGIVRITTTKATNDVLIRILGIEERPSQYRVVTNAPAVIYYQGIDTDWVITNSYLNVPAVVREK